MLIRYMPQYFDLILQQTTQNEFVLMNPLTADH